MASRPTFQRTNTERAENNADIELQGSPSSPAGPSKKGDYEYRNPDSKDGAAVEVSSFDDHPPEYEDAGDGFAKVTEPVETAKDLVTQVIHVDDDPSLSPYTFRVFFLGTSDA